MKLFGKRDASDELAEDALRNDDRLEFPPERRRKPPVLLLSGVAILGILFVAGPALLDTLGGDELTITPVPTDGTRVRAPDGAAGDAGSAGIQEQQGSRRGPSRFEQDPDPGGDAGLVRLRSTSGTGDDATDSAGDGSWDAPLLARARSRDPGDLVSRFGSFDGRGTVRHVFASPPEAPASPETADDGTDQPQSQGETPATPADDPSELPIQDSAPEPIPHHRVTLVMVSRHGSRAVVDSSIVRAGDSIEAGLIIGIGSGGILVDGRFGRLEYDLGVAGARRIELDEAEPAYGMPLTDAELAGEASADAAQQAQVAEDEGDGSVDETPSDAADAGAPPEDGEPDKMVHGDDGEVDP